jgi:UDP-glucose 4-epimerase
MITDHRRTAIEDGACTVDGTADRAWLVTGGAGYIGSHVVRALEEAGERVVVLDDLSTGVADRVHHSTLVRADVLDSTAVARACVEHGVVGVIHLAAKKSVQESVADPLLYYRENVEGLRSLLEAGARAGVRSLVFSSSAAVYGEVTHEPVTEDDLARPSNPYGRTKLIGEQMIREVAAATGLRWVALRYFNVAGAREPVLADRASVGLIPSTLRRLAAGAGPQIFGRDYPTSDGTCVRDFIHATDVASAHVAAALALVEREVNEVTVNIGSGAGTSVLEVAEAARSIAGVADEPWSQIVWQPRRAGDPAYSVAAVDRARELLGWQARAGLHEMISSEWASL